MITDEGSEKQAQDNEVHERLAAVNPNCYADIDAGLCMGCGNCIDRCPVHAIANQDGVSVVAREKCIGCGLCVTGCPNSAAILQKKPEAEIVAPPADFAAWEHARLHNPGLGD